MVLDIKNGNEWQFLDKDKFSVLPWYTRSCLDELEEIKVSDKIVFEYGLGVSSIWYAKYAKLLYGVESNKQWWLDIHETLLHHRLLAKTFLYFEDEKENYIESIKEHKIDFDIIVVDGIYRNECTLMAIEIAKKGTTIILDNWMQPSVEIASEEVQELVNSHNPKIFKQEGHPDWQTAIIIK